MFFFCFDDTVYITGFLNDLLHLPTETGVSNHRQSLLVGLLQFPSDQRRMFWSA